MDDFSYAFPADEWNIVSNDDGTYFILDGEGLPLSDASEEQSPFEESMYPLGFESYKMCWLTPLRRCRDRACPTGRIRQQGPRRRAGQTPGRHPTPGLCYSPKLRLQQEFCRSRGRIRSPR